MRLTGREKMYASVRSLWRSPIVAKARGQLPTVAFVILAATVLSADSRGREFIAGADISALPVLENGGAVYRAGGQVGDAVDILRDGGTNWFRLRLFVEPNPAGDAFVVNDLAYTIELAKRVKASGAKLLLDYHYSDTWADPGKQFKPAAWTSLDQGQLQQQVYDYTRSSIEAFKAEGVLPEMVQIGNEISNGMLWNPAPNPAGPNSGYPWTGGSHNTGFDRLAGLLQAGIDGARDGAGPSEEPLIMIHHDKGAQWSTTSFYFDKLRDRNVEFDVIGYSYYPKFHYNPTSGAGDIDDLTLNLNNTAARYGKPVVVVETGFASRGAQFEPQYEFSVSAAGQQQFLQAVVDAVLDVPDDLGWGVFWWYAEARPVSGLSVWEGGRYGLFDQNGNILPALDVFAALAPTPGDYNGDGIVDAADYTVWRDTLGSSDDLRANGDDTGASAGVIDGADYDVWKVSFGTTDGNASFELPLESLASGHAAGVPEPATLVVLAQVCLALAAGRRAKSQAARGTLAPSCCRD